MKTLLKTKIAVVVMSTVFLLSCKNNKDGYSDEIVTTQTPIDSTATDTTQINTGTNSTGATGTPSEAITGAGSTSAASTTAGKGSGPGESAKDGSTYTSSSPINDTTSTKAKAVKKKENKK